MVGVPGKSKGCNTCRKRKKGCDQARPACGQCTRSGLQCAGYERHRTFVNASHSGPDAGAANNGPSVSTAGHTHALTVTRISPLASVQTLQHGLSRTAHEVRCIGLFWDAYLPRGGEHLSEYYLGHSVAGWTAIARDNYRSDPALYRALLAMSLATLGRRRADRPLRQEGLRQYVRALGEMKTALRSPRRRRSDALLMASRTLGLYEMLYARDCETATGTQDAAAIVSQADSWQGHSLGEMALVAMRAPELQVDNPSHALFCDGRMGNIIASINLRRRSIFAEPRWKTVPWSKIPKTPNDMLWDVLADIPGLLEDVDALQALPAGLAKAALHQALVAECWRLHGELAWWHDTLCPRDRFAELEARGLDAPDHSPDDQATAGIMINYWTGCLLVYSNLRGLLAAHPATAAAIPSLDPSTDPLHYCDRIGDLIGFFLHPSAGAYSWHQTPFPAGIASGYLLTTGRVRSPQMAKLARFFAREDGGRDVALFLKSMLDSGYGDWPAAGEDGEDVKSVVMRNLSGGDAVTPESGI